MKTICKVSIEVKVTKGVHDEASKIAGRLKAHWGTIHRAWQADYIYLKTLERLRNLQTRYADYQSVKHQKFLSQWPPHSILCEGRCCNKSFRAYHQFLKKQLVWDAKGHLK